MMSKSLSDEINKLNKEINKHAQMVRVTQTQYENLSYEEMHSGKIYVITDYYNPLFETNNISYNEDKPKKLHPLICSKCGGQIHLEKDSGKCPYCGTEYSAKYFIED